MKTSQVVPLRRDRSTSELLAFRSTPVWSPPGRPVNHLHPRDWPLFGYAPSGVTCLSKLWSGLFDSNQRPQTETVTKLERRKNRRRGGRRRSPAFKFSSLSTSSWVVNASERRNINEEESLMTSWISRRLECKIEVNYCLSQITNDNNNQFLALPRRADHTPFSTLNLAQ